MTPPEASGAPVELEASCGRLRGRVRDGLHVFRGIPYAQPPVGALRWAPPRPPAPWAGVREASAPGACAPQGPSLIDRILPDQIGPQSEDCLFLDIWTPSPAGRRPVMVWIHGGAFMIGAGNSPLYDGARLAEQGDVVVVSINYRIGSLGFINLRDATDGTVSATGSEGLMDQIAALQWAREHIASFGGDPARVTVFGESAGALSIGCLLAMPRAQGLFHRAILQSGAAHVGYSREKSARVGRALLDILGIAPAQAAQLRELPAEAILRAQATLVAESREQGDPRRLGVMPYGPVIDGEWLTDLPIASVRARGSVPLIVGAMRDEYRFFAAGDARLRALDAAGLQALVHAACGAEAGDALLQAYAEGSPYERFCAVVGDRLFGVPARLLAQAGSQAGAAPCCVYRVDHASPLLDGAFGACHFIDAGLVFGTHADSPFFGPGPQADRISAEMVQAWTGFAHGRMPWAAYGNAGQTMLFGPTASCVVEDPEAARHAAWQALGDHVGFV